MRGAFRPSILPAAGVGEEAGAQNESLAGMIKCSEIDYDYESWSEQQIQVFIPDGASSGNIRIQTDRGLSNALYFESDRKCRNEELFRQDGFPDRIHGIDISGAEGQPPNGLDLWVPAVQPGLVQRNIETVTEPEPLWNDYMGIMRYHFDDLELMSNYSVSIKSWFERYNIETRIVPSRVSRYYNEERRLYKAYTASESLGAVGFRGG